MRLALVGPGRAGTAVALAARGAGHEIVSVSARDPASAGAAAHRLGGRALAITDRIEGADVVLVAVRDDAIAEVAAQLDLRDIGGVVHLSGAAPVAVLRPIADRGIPTGSFHPLQTLPTPEAGAARLAGAWVGITAPEPLHSLLHELAASIGTQPFHLDDDVKPLYHAAAAASANFPLAALAVARDLFAAARVPWEASRPLVGAIIANAYSMGPREALTGPIARGDVGTVAAQLAAVAEGAPEWEEAFRHLIAVTAAVAGRTADFEGL